MSSSSDTVFIDFQGPDVRDRDPVTLGMLGEFQPARLEEAVEKEEEVEESPAQPAAKTPLPAPAPQAPQGIPADLLAGLQAQIAAADALVPKAPAKAEKLRLQKVHNLFEWTGKAVKKYGFDRLEMMLDSYATMGYLERDEVAQVREIARLMPASLGEADEMKAEDFVSELYVLNRILDHTRHLPGPRHDRLWMNN